MAYDQSSGTLGLRSEVVDKVVKGYAEAQYKFKQALAVTSTSGYKNTYFRENPTALASPATNSIKGIPRGANFPQGMPTWEEQQSYIEQYGIEGSIPWLDILTNDIDQQARTMFRLTEAVTKAVDDQIYQALIADSGINTITISGGSNGKCWDLSSAAIFDDLANAKRLMKVSNYDPVGVRVFINPKDEQSITSYLASKGAQWPSVGSEIVRNGNIGQVNGFDFTVSNSVPASEALVVIPKTCGRWLQVYPLSTHTETDPFRSVRIRVTEVGVAQITDPKAIVRIRNTQSA